jgi:hypothetical protein
MEETPEAKCQAELETVRVRIEALEKSLPTELDPLALSRAKIPFKALSCREALIWRFTELARDAHEGFAARRLCSAILLTRACVETTAAMWYLLRRIERCLKEEALGDFDDYVMKLSVGSRVNPEMPRADSVLKFIDGVAKELPEYRDQYEKLCEFAHPNWAGTVGMFCRTDHEKVMTYYGRDIRDNPYPFAAGVYNLSVALRMFEHSYNKLRDVTPDFVKFCEDLLPPEAAS